MNKQIIILTGEPCKEKTSLAIELSKKLDLPLFSESCIKENCQISIFSIKDKRTHDYQTKMICYRRLIALLESNLSFIFEANLNTKEGQKFYKLITKNNNFECIEKSFEELIEENILSLKLK